MIVDILINFISLRLEDNIFAQGISAWPVDGIPLRLIEKETEMIMRKITIFPVFCVVVLWKKESFVPNKFLSDPPLIALSGIAAQNFLEDRILSIEDH